MKRISKKILGIVISLLVLFSGIGWEYKSNNDPNTDLSSESNTTTEYIEGDFLGTGSKQQIAITMDERSVKIEAFENGSVISSGLFDNGPLKPSSAYSVIKINQNKPREYIRWDQFVGPHQAETFMLTINPNRVILASAADNESEVWYAPFWSSRGNTYIGDIDSDGIAEVIEYVDEFPPNAPRLVDPEIEKITRSEFPDELEDDMWSIVSRENSGEGRGRKVIWNVYTVTNEDPLLFEKANKEKYEKLTADIFNAMDMLNQEVEGSEEVMSKFDLAQDSIDFNNFVRNFWTQGQLNTFAFE